MGARLAVVGGLAAAGPFMILKGGISSKPSMSRLLGSAPRADAMAVERERPLEDGQSLAKTRFPGGPCHGSRSLSGDDHPPALARTSGDSGRLLDPDSAEDPGCYLGIMLGLCAFALMRVHMMAGYCTPRHAMVVAWILTLAGGAGLAQLVADPRSSWSQAEGRALGCRQDRGGPDGCRTLVFILVSAPALTAPIDSGFAGYREAGEWLATKTSPGERVIDPKGLALFYAAETGYTFARLTDGAHDPNVRWLVAHEAFLHGPWDYCKLLRELVGDRRPTQTFPLHATRATRGCSFSTWHGPAIRQRGPCQSDASGSELPFILT